MTVPEVIPLNFPEFVDVRIVKSEISFTVEQCTKDAMGELRWETLGKLCGDTRYVWGNKDASGHDIPHWVFYIALRLFDLEKLIKIWEKKDLLRKGYEVEK